MEQFQTFKRPRIRITENLISISDPPILWRIFLTFFSLFLALLAYLDSQADQRQIGIILGVSLACVFFYDSLSLNRVKIDLEDKVIFRRSFNPLENLIDLILQHPSKIPFDSISKIYVDKPNWIGTGVRRYYLILKTMDPYILKIGIFSKADEAEMFAGYLNHELKYANRK